MNEYEVVEFAVKQTETMSADEAADFLEEVASQLYDIVSALREQEDS